MLACLETEVYRGGGQWILGRENPVIAEARSGTLVLMPFHDAPFFFGHSVGQSFESASAIVARTELLSGWPDDLLGCLFAFLELPWSCLIHINEIIAAWCNVNSEAAGLLEPSRCRLRFFSFC